jgi:hypothetical protein
MAWRPSAKARLILLCVSAGLVAGAFSLRAIAQGSGNSNDSSPPITTPPTEKDYAVSQGTSKLKIEVTNPKGNPVSNASVYVRYPKPGTLFHHDELQELDLKTNQDGSVKVPPVPQGKVEVQVIAKGWHTFGEWYDVEKDEQTVTIQLQEPPHWY